jgi:hypothetical protein
LWGVQNIPDFFKDDNLITAWEDKAWNKQYRIAVCDVKYAYCYTTLQGDLQKKKNQ